MMEPEDEQSIWKMILFVAMIAVGIMIISCHGSADIEQKRALMQTYSVHETSPVVKETAKPADIA